MTYSIIGTGGIGGYYGGRLAEAGHDVHHRSMEIHYLYTRPLQIARQAGVPMHKLEMLEAELRFLEDGLCETSQSRDEQYPDQSASFTF